MRIDVKIFVTSMVLLLSLTNSCQYSTQNLNQDKVDDPNYPSIIESLSFDELEKLQQEFDSLNSNSIRTKLNKYGLIGERDSRKIHRNPGVQLNHKQAIQIACNSLVRNKQFTNTGDSLELVRSISAMRPLESDSSDWLIMFGPQIYNGYEIRFSKINVWLYGDGVYQIRGHWYKNIYIPPVDNFSANEAIPQIIGEKILWSGFNGDLNIFTVTRGSIDPNIKKEIITLEKDERIELRVTWEIPIIKSSFIGWHIYVDTSTGEIVQIVQEFAT